MIKRLAKRKNRFPFWQKPKRRGGLRYYNDEFDQTSEWLYDLVGNRLKQTVNGTETNYEYDVNDRLLQEVTGSKNTLYGYDHTQQTSKSVSENGVLVSETTFEYDAQGRMAVVTIVTENRKEVTKYEYGADGIRVSAEHIVSENGVVIEKTLTEYLNDPLNITGYSQVLKQVKTDLETGEQTHILYVIGHQRISQLVVKNGTEQEYYFTFDGHGSTRALIGLTGAIVQLYAFDAYGNALGFNTNEALTEFLYSGEQFDAKIGQQYLRARYYDPATGRFNRLDPFFGNTTDPQSFHKYLYTHADPVNGVDPTGLENSISISISTAIGNGISALNNITLSGYITVYNWSVGAPVTFRLIQYGMASLSVVGTLTSPDPAMDFLLGPAGVVDDLVSIGNGLKGISQMLAKSPKIVDVSGKVYRGLALFKETDHLNRAQGIVARILPENISTSLGSQATMDPVGWQQLVSQTSENGRARGHLLARWFGGSGNDVVNLVPLYRSTNDKMRILVETPIANSLRGTNAKYTEVIYAVTPHYTGNNLIPDHIEIKAIGIDINGVDRVIFDNKILNQP